MIKAISGVLLVANTGIFLYLFIRIMLEGRIFIHEPNIYILGAELAVSSLITLFGVYLVVTGLKGGDKKKTVIISEDYSKSN